MYDGLSTDYTDTDTCIRGPSGDSGLSPDEAPHDGGQRGAAVRRQRHLQLHRVGLELRRRVLPVGAALGAEPLHQRRDLVIGLDESLPGAAVHGGETHCGGQVRSATVPGSGCPR